MKKFSLKKLIILGVLILFIVSGFLLLRGKFNRKNAASLIATITLIITILDNIEIVLSFIERLTGVSIEPKRKLPRKVLNIQSGSLKMAIIGPRPFDIKGVSPPFEYTNIVRILGKSNASIKIELVIPPTFTNFKEEIRAGIDILYFDGFLFEDFLLFERENGLSDKIRLDLIIEILDSLGSRKPHLLVLGIRKGRVKDIGEQICKKLKITIVIFNGNSHQMSSFIEKFMAEMISGSTIGEAFNYAKKFVQEQSINHQFKSFLCGKRKLKLDVGSSTEGKLSIKTLDWFFVPNPVQTKYFVGEFTGEEKPVGRLDMVFKIVNWLLGKNQNRKLVLIIGEGGFGKTALAYYAAKKLAYYFKGGCLWFSGKGKREVLLDTFLDDTFGLLLGENLLRARGELKVQMVMRYLRTQAQIGNHVLIIADNIEHASEDVWSFLANLPEGNSAIITSRENPTSLPIPAMLKVGELTTNEAMYMLKLLMEDEDLVINQDIITELAEVTGKVPAVIEFVARDVKLKGLSQTLKDLKEHPSVRLTSRFDFSYEPLDPNFKKFLWLISIIPGSFEAKLIGNMVEKLNLEGIHIFDTDWRNYWNELEDRGQWIRRYHVANRYEMHPVVRDYLGHKADPETLDKFEKAFVKVMLVEANKGVSYLNSPKARVYVDTIAYEKDNLLGALEIGCRKKMWDEVLQMTYAVDKLFTRSGHWSERWEVLNIGLKATRHKGDKYHQAKILNLLGILSKSQGLSEYAKKYFKKSLSIFQNLGKKEDAMRVMVNMGNLYQNLGRYTEAEQIYKQALDFYSRRSMKFELASLYTNLGVLSIKKNALVEAENFLKEAIKIYKELNKMEEMASVLVNLGLLHLSLDKEDAAKKYLMEALAIKKELGDKKGMAFAYLNFGLLLSEQAQYGEAKKYYEEAINIFKEIGSKKELSKVYHNLGIDYKDQGKYDKARYYLEEALRIREDFKDDLGKASTLTELGDLYSIEGNFTEAIECYKNAVEIFLDFRKKDKIAFILKEIGEILVKFSDYENAFTSFMISYKILNEIKAPHADNVYEQIRDLLTLVGKKEEEIENMLKATSSEYLEDINRIFDNFYNLLDHRESSTL